MRAMIWAAGLGTRLRPLTEDKPKAMVPVLGKPMLEHALLTCKAAGITEVMINVHYFADLIRDTFGDGSDLGMHIEYSYEEELLENAGGLVRVKDFFEGDEFVAFGSDNLAGIDLAEMMNFHRQAGALATIATTRAEDVEKFGILETAEDGSVLSFQEKPKREEARGDQVATCIYGFSPAIFDHLPSTPTVCHFGRHVFPELIAGDAPVFAYEIKGTWDDIGNPHDYLRANFDALRRQLDATPGQRYIAGNNCTISPEADIVGPVFLGEGVTIGAGAQIGPHAVLGDGVTVAEHASVQEAVLWKNVQLDTGSSVSRAVLSQDCRVYPYAKVDGLVVSAASQLSSLPD